MNRRGVDLLGFIPGWGLDLHQGGRSSERRRETVVEEETQSVRRKTEASGLELDQVTVGAVEVKRDSKEAESGGQEKSDNRERRGIKGRQDVNNSRQRERRLGEEKVADAPCKISVVCAAAAASA